MHRETRIRIFAAADRVGISTTLGTPVDGTRLVDLAQLDRAVTVEMAPELGTETVEFSVVDDSPRPDINPYWKINIAVSIRPIRYDGSMNRKST